MRWVIGFVLALVLVGAVRLIGCGETTSTDGDGGSGGVAGDGGSGGTGGVAGDGGNGGTGGVAGDGGNGGTGGTAGTGGSTVHRVFISSVRFAPDFGSLNNADSRCQALAIAQSLDGTWKALISDSSTSVQDRITVSGPVVNFADELVAADAEDFFDGVALNAVDIDETGDAPADTVAWVGNSTDNCLDWTFTNSGHFGQQAQSTQLDGWLYGVARGPCYLMRSLYCISQ